MEKEDKKCISNDLDIKIDSVKQWIKFNYGRIEIKTQDAIDHQSHELDMVLERFYIYRKQKEQLMSLDIK